MGRVWRLPRTIQFPVRGRRRSPRRDLRSGQLEFPCPAVHAGRRRRVAIARAGGSGGVGIVSLVGEKIAGPRRRRHKGFVMLQPSVRVGLTFDDVLLVPGKSSVLPTDTDTRTRFTRRITINIPIVSAAMDTVTESRLAIALAREGGIGIIHRVFLPAEQAAEVDKVKKSESGMILDPITISPDNTIRDAHKIMAEFRISGIPVTKNGKLVGIVTNRDLRFETRMELKISQVMTRENLITAPEGTTLDKAREILHQHRIEKLLVVNDRFELKGLITIKDIAKRIQYPDACKDAHGRLRVGAAVGVGADAEERLALLTQAGVDVVV